MHAKRGIGVIANLLMCKIIQDFRGLDTTKVELLKQMRTAALDIIKKYKAQNPKLEFKIGFHAVPSMKQIHMHIIRCN